MALSEKRAGRCLELAILLGTTPLADALASATDCPPRTPAGPADGGLRPILPAQREMLLSEKFAGAAGALHQLISIELLGQLDEPALLAALRGLVARHESLRTVFVRTPDGSARRVLAESEPRIVRQRLRAAVGDDPIRVVHDQLIGALGGLLEPMRRPPVAFTLTRLGPQRNLLSIAIHHVIADGWAAGLLLREIVANYRTLRRGEAIDPTPAPTPESWLTQAAALAGSGRIEVLARDRIARLSDLPTVVELPTDLPRPETLDFAARELPFGISDAARDAADGLATRAQVTRTVVLLAAWQLVIGRRCGLDRFIIGTPAIARPSAELMDVVMSAAVTVPVRVELDDQRSVAQYLRGSADAVGDAVAGADVPFARLVEALCPDPDHRRLPLVQMMFTAHDEYIPHELAADVRVHDAHCGGTASDVGLYVRRWGREPRLAIEYTTSVLTPAEAMDLAEAFEATLLDLAAHYEQPLRRVRGMSMPQRERLTEFGCGPELDTEQGLWELVEARLVAGGNAIAVEDPRSGHALTCAELLTTVKHQAALLHDAGVGIGDHVLIAVPRSTAEVVAVLAALRQGAAYVVLDPANPRARQETLLKPVAPRAVIGTGSALDELLDPACARIAALDRPARPAPEIPAAAPPDPGRVVYLVFTSGSTGEPKAVRATARGVVRLVADPHLLRCGPGDRVLRFASLCFDIGSLELFGPLAAGATLVTYPDDGVSHTAISAFFAQQRITTCFLPAGLFRLLVDHGIEAFAGVRHVLVGGDVLTAQQVCALLTRFPGTRVTNGYGPTENSILTTTHTMTDPSEVTDPVPIGVAVAGTGIRVTDRHGEDVPPGGSGEMRTFGAGLALDYFGRPELTEAAFVESATGREYRSGDLVRWDGQGRLCFLGRVDRQAKVRGFRVELEEIRRRLEQHPMVREAAVAVSGADAATGRLVAGVVVDPAMVEPVAELRRFVAEVLPRYAVPALWAVVETLPVNRAGKHDVAALVRIALGDETEGGTN
jgi:amino acid adenylation domain-containing protein